MEVEGKSGPEHKIARNGGGKEEVRQLEFQQFLG